MSVRLATYNIHKFVGADGKRNEERIAAVLRTIDADVVALQEFVLEDKSADLRAVESFAAKLGYGFVAQPMRRANGMIQFNLLLTRLPLRSTSLFGLPRDGREPRGVIDVELNARGRSLRVAATHLGLNSRARARQLTKLLDVCAAPRDMGFALIGDLNIIFPWERAKKILERHFPGQKRRATFPARLPFLAFDAIYLRNLQADTAPFPFAGEQARIASDHLPLIADVAL